MAGMEVEPAAKRDRDAAALPTAELDDAMAQIPLPKRRRSSLVGKPRRKQSAYQYYKLGPGKDIPVEAEGATSKQKAEAARGAWDHIESMARHSLASMKPDDRAAWELCTAQAEADAKRYDVELAAFQEQQKTAAVAAQEATDAASDAQEVSKLRNLDENGLLDYVREVRQLRVTPLAAADENTVLQPLLSSLTALTPEQLVGLIGDLVRTGILKASAVQSCAPAPDVGAVLEKCHNLVKDIEKAFPRGGNNGDSFCWRRCQVPVKAAKAEIMSSINNYRQCGQWEAALAFAEGATTIVEAFPSFDQSKADSQVAAAVAKLKAQAMVKKRSVVTLSELTRALSPRRDCLVCTGKLF
eukprot:COSAG02_NODE_2958_length_7663_cov_9.892782_3_plen_356_part_00